MKMVESILTADCFEDWPSNHLEEISNITAETKAQPVLQKFEMLTLFPRVYVPEDDHMVNSGLILLPTQSIVSAAEQEFSQYIASKKQKVGRSRTILGGSRRLSIRDDERNGVRREAR